MGDAFKLGALYVRVSTDRQEELSPDAQKRLLKEYAKKNNIMVDSSHIFIENGISGKRADKRPEFQRMIAMAKEKPRPFDVILVWKFSRFARNQDESAFYKSILRKKCGIDVISITEPIAEGMYGRLIEMIIEWNDEFYSYNLSQEVRRGMDEKALKHGYQLRPPLGYAAVGKGRPYVIVEDDYKIYQYIADQYDLYGQDPTSIARSLNDLGWKTKSGNAFEARTIRQLLRNPFYAGIVAWNGHTFKGAHEARISEERFQQRLKKMDNLYLPKVKRDVSSCRHWLSGIVRCPICGANLGFNNSKRAGTPPFFQCWKYGKGFHKGSCSITEQKLIRGVFQNFEDILNGKDFTFHYYPSHSKEDRSKVTFLRQELSKIENREKRIQLAYENEIDTLEEYKENKLRLRSEKERLLSELESVTSNKSTIPSKKDVLENIQTVYEALKDPNLDYTTKGAFLRSVVEYIVYDKEQEQLRFYWYTK